MVIDSTTNSTKDFSARFNLFLDYHPTIPKGRGRTIELANLLGMNRLTVRLWLKENSKPKDDTLKKIVSRLLEDINIHTGPKSIILWLIDGNELYNPFKNPNINKLDHLTQSKMYMAVSQIANNMGINLEKMDDIKRDLIYDTILLSLNSNEEPDITLIINLLRLAS